MRFLILITAISSFLLLWSRPFTSEKAWAFRAPPAFIQKALPDFKETFKKAENANVLWAFMTGEKKGIPPKTKKDFKDLQLAFLFSPSGLHLSAVLLLLFFFIKKKAPKKLARRFLILALFLSLFLPYLAIKRIALLRLLILLKNKMKLKLSLEFLFLLTFGLSFSVGHFKESPIGFIYSFLIMGTFIALRDFSRPKILIAILAAHLLIGLFSGEAVSPFSLLINVPFIGLFSLLLPLTYLYLASFKWISFNWVEPLVRQYILAVHKCASFIQGSQWAPSIPLVLFLWLILLGGKKRYMLIALILHATVANSPVCFFSGSYSRAHSVSADR